MCHGPAPIFGYFLGSGRKAPVSFRNNRSVCASALSPNFRFDADVRRAFLELLPRTTREVEHLTRQHDRRLVGRSQVEALTDDLPIRHTLEVRHPSFSDSRYVDLLREHGIASCVADSAGRYPLIAEATADFVYARLHGAKELYVSGYSPEELEPWAERIRRWRQNHEVFVYFDNDVKVQAPGYAPEPSTRQALVTPREGRSRRSSPKTFRGFWRLTRCGLTEIFPRPRLPLSSGRYSAALGTADSVVEVMSCAPSRRKISLARLA